jgi:putative SOS response-associated peptidase YedK
MPVILAPNDHQVWLSEDDGRNIGELPRQYPSKAMRAYRISTSVNNVTNDRPESIEPSD